MRWGWIVVSVFAVGCPADDAGSGATTGSSSSAAASSEAGTEAPADTTGTTGVGSSSGTTGEAGARWCDVIMPMPAACADFDGPLLGWLPPDPTPVYTIVEDDTVFLSPPRSMRFHAMQDFTVGGTPSFGEFHWSQPIGDIPARMRGLFHVYFTGDCGSQMIRIGFENPQEQELSLQVSLNPGSVTVWSDEPGSFQQPWWEPQTLPLEQWIEVELVIDLTDLSATIRLDDDVSPFQTLWETAASFRATSAIAVFGPATGPKADLDCTYYMDDIAIALQ